MWEGKLVCPTVGIQHQIPAFITFWAIEWRVMKNNAVRWNHSDPWAWVIISEWFYYTTKTYTPSILHLTQIRCNSLIINILLSVRCCKFHLHATCTTYILPHGTSTGGIHHSIGEQKSLLLRLIFLCPSGVQSTAYVQTDCKMYAGVCMILWNHLTLLKCLYINLLRAKSVRWQ